jgi:hypothetical protein
VLRSVFASRMPADNVLAESTLESSSLLNDQFLPSMPNSCNNFTGLKQCVALHSSLH